MPIQKKTGASPIEESLQKIDAKKNFCRICPEISSCQAVCGALNLYLDRDLPKNDLEVMVGNVDHTIAFQSRLSLADMETIIGRARERLLPNLGLEAEDFKVVEGAGLTSKQKFVMFHHFWRNKSVRAIAGEIKISHAAVGTLLNRGRKKLYKHLLQLKTMGPKINNEM